MSNGQNAWIGRACFLVYALKFSIQGERIVNFRKLLPASGALLLAVAGNAFAQADDSTIRAIPDPAADLPEAVTRDVPFPVDTASDEGATHSEAGRSGERRDAGLETARNAGAEGLATAAEAAEHGLDTAADAAQDGLDTAQDAAADAAEEALQNASNAADQSREDFGRDHAPDALPDQIPDHPAPAAGG